MDPLIKSQLLCQLSYAPAQPTAAGMVSLAHVRDAQTRDGNHRPDRCYRPLRRRLKASLFDRSSTRSTFARRNPTMRTCARLRAPTGGGEVRRQLEDGRDQDATAAAGALSAVARSR